MSTTPRSPMSTPPNRLRVGSRHARGAPCEPRHRAHARRGGRPPEGARLQRSGRTKGHPVLKFLGKFWGMSAWMLELIMVLSAVLRKILGSRRGGRAAGRQCRVELHAGAPGRRRRRDAAATVAGQCARAARVELAGHSRPGTGPRRHRPRAPRRHHPGGRETPHRER